MSGRKEEEKVRIPQGSGLVVMLCKSTQQERIYPQQARNGILFVVTPDFGRQSLHSWSLHTHRHAADGPCTRFMNRRVRAHPRFV